MARALYSGVDEYGQPSEVMLGCAIGDIIPHFGTTPPPGTLVCDGSEVSREAYAELYEEVGALVGQGDGSTTFNLPDLRGRWLMGADAEHEAGEEVAEGLPNVTGQFRPRESGGYPVTGTFIGAFERGSSYTNHIIAFDLDDPASGYELLFDASASSAVYGAQDHVTPASVAVLPCIVYE